MYTKVVNSIGVIKGIKMLAQPFEFCITVPASQTAYTSGIMFAVFETLPARQTRSR